MRQSAWEAWSAPALWAVLTGGLHLLPGAGPLVPGSGWFEGLLASLPFLDKVGHAALFAVLAALTVRGFRRAGRRGGVGREVGRRGGLGARRAVGLAIGLSIVYGVALELVQDLVPGRTGDSFDALADALGACLGAILVGNEPPASTSRIPSRRQDETS